MNQIGALTVGIGLPQFKRVLIIVRFVMATGSKVSVKSRMLAFLQKKTGYNTFSAAQATARWGVRNVSAVIASLRNDGYAIYSNPRRRADGSRVHVYRLGTPRQSMLSTQ